MAVRAPPATRSRPALGKYFQISLGIYPLGVLQRRSTSRESITRLILVRVLDCASLTLDFCKLYLCLSGFRATWRQGPCWARPSAAQFQALAITLTLNCPPCRYLSGVAAPRK